MALGKLGRSFGKQGRTSTETPTAPAPSYGIREDGGFELREDGGKELRE